jgi:hypothetical protein
VSGSCRTIPRAPCPVDSASALLSDPPPPAPTWPGDAGSGEAFSHGEDPFALPTITWSSPDRIAVSGVVVAVLVEVDAGGLLAFGLELEHPAITIANTAKIAAILHFMTNPP